MSSGKKRPWVKVHQNLGPKSGTYNANLVPLIIIPYSRNLKLFFKTNPWKFEPLWAEIFENTKGDKI